MTLSGKEAAEVIRLTWLLDEDRITPGQLRWLERQLLENAEARQLYLACVALQVDLTQVPIETNSANRTRTQEHHLGPAYCHNPARIPSQWNWRRTGLVAGTLAACVLAMVFLTQVGLQHFPGPAHTPGKVQIVDFFGPARLLSTKGTLLPLQKGQRVEPGETLRLGGEEGFLALRYDDSTQLTLGPGSVLRLPPGDSPEGAAEKRLLLLHGFMRMETPEHPPEPLVLVTPHAEVRAPGSKVNFWSLPEATQVEAEEGDVNLVRRSDGCPMNLARHNFVVVSLDRAALKPLPLPVATKPRAVLEDGTGPIRDLAFASDGTTLAVAGWKGRVRLWDTVAAAPHRFLENTSVMRCLACSPDRQWLVSGVDGPDRLQLWPLGVSAPPSTLEGLRTRVQRVLFTTDGQAIVSAGGSGSVVELKVWDLATRQVRRELHGHTKRILDTALSPDGKFLATASKDRTVRLWDLARGVEVQQFPLNNVETRAVAFSPDSRFLATGGADGWVTLWSIASGRQQVRFQAYPRVVKSLSFSPEGALLATAGDHPAAKVWQVATGRELAAFRGHGYAVQKVVFSPRGSTLAVAGSDGNVKLWDVPFPAEPASRGP